MEILHFSGLESDLFSLVAPLAMNPEVLKYNNNYPFKTSEHFEWYVAVEEGQVLGFLPVEERNGSCIINNYYIKDNNQDVLKSLLDEVVPGSVLYAVVQTAHERIFAECGFEMEHRWTNYKKMINVRSRT